MCFFFHSGDEATETSSDDEVVNNDQEPVPTAPRRPVQRLPPSPALKKRVPLAGTSLKLKKGRRARHRYDSERSLFAFADIDPEVAPEGWDIPQENSSHFRSLLDNPDLLNQFLDRDESQEDNKKFKNCSVLKVK